MQSRDRFLIAAALVAVAAIASVVSAPDLPNELVTRWDAAGDPAATMDKTVGLALIPVLSMGLLGVFWVIPKIDPLRENIQSFRVYYDWFVVLFAGFMSAVQTGIVAYNLGYEFDFTVLVLVGVAGLFYYVGVLLEAAERNWFIGIRTPWTLSSDEVWDRTHAIGARLFKLAAVLALVGVFFDSYGVWFIVVPAVLTAVGTIVYSYVVYERLGRPADEMRVD